MCPNWYAFLGHFFYHPNWYVSLIDTIFGDFFWYAFFFQKIVSIRAYALYIKLYSKYFLKKSENTKSKKKVQHEEKKYNKYKTRQKGHGKYSTN